MNNAVDIILDAIRPSKSEPSVTYTIPNGAGGNIYVKMPRLFVDLGDDFERWFREENEDLVNKFYNEFRVLFVKGGAECDRVISLFSEAWSYEEYYKFLIGCWQIQNENYEKRNEEANDLKDWGKVGWYQKKIEETRILIFKAKAALYFIHKTKSIIKPYIGIPGTGQPTLSKASPPVATSTESKEIFISDENIERIYNVLAPYFQGQETKLRQLLEGKTIEEPLNWSKNANQLTHVFWGAKRKGWILDTNVRTCEWILRNFRYNNAKTFDRNSVTKDLNTQVTRCQKPLTNTDF